MLLVSDPKEHLYEENLSTYRRVIVVGGRLQYVGVRLE
jgi:hypothetical protein